MIQLIISFLYTCIAALLRENVSADPAVYKHICLDWFRSVASTPFFIVFVGFFIVFMWLFSPGNGGTMVADFGRRPS